MEIWKDIEGYNNRYQVSNLANVRSLNYGRMKMIKNLVACINGHGYPQVRLIGKVVTVHRLIAQAFIPNPENKPEVNHINGIKSDNRLENLEWVTSKVNAQHAWDIGLNESNRKSIIGMANYQTHLTDDDVKFIYQYTRKFGSGVLLAKKFNVSASVISCIKRKKIWTHVTNLL
jgi:hypothetical protein